MVFYCVSPMVSTIITYGVLSPMIIFCADYADKVRQVLRHETHQPMSKVSNNSSIVEEEKDEEKTCYLSGRTKKFVYTF
jgi:hypothetical protein